MERGRWESFCCFCFVREREKEGDELAVTDLGIEMKIVERQRETVLVES